MTSLFSPFDLFQFTSSNFFMMFVIFILMSPVFKISGYLMSMSFVWSPLSSFFYSLKEGLFTKGFSFFLFSFFILIFILNFSSLWPYNFSSTSQLSVVMLMSIPFWVSSMILQVSKNFNYFLGHLVPEGTPIYLTWFLVMIELISSMIRPITLTVRLLANILAGHLMMILLSKLIMLFPVSLPLFVFLNLVEVFVSLIQSYIFCTMICLYFSELS